MRWLGRREGNTETMAGKVRTREQRAGEERQSTRTLKRERDSVGQRGGAGARDPMGNRRGTPGPGLCLVSSC